MPEIPTIISGVLIAIGSFFILVGGIGIVRMPDVFTRMHAAGIKDTMGAGFLLAGMAVVALQQSMYLVAFKLLLLFLLFLFTSPVVSHALAQAALHDGIKPLLGKKNNGSNGPAKKKKAAKGKSRKRR